jgi:hypothetical protein
MWFEKKFLMSSVVICFGALRSQSFCSNAETFDDDESLTLDEISRMKKNLDLKNLKLSYETKNGVKVYSLKSVTPSFPIVRLATTEIDSDVETIISYWENHKLRKDWDASVYDITELDRKNYNQLIKKPKSFIPKRDYIYRSLRYPGGVFGFRDFNVVALVHLNADLKHKNISNLVRGKANSVLIVQPKTKNVTKITLYTEANPMGWLPYFPGLFLVDWLYGSTLSESLGKLDDDCLKRLSFVP